MFPPHIPEVGNEIFFQMTLVDHWAEVGHTGHCASKFSIILKGNIEVIGILFSMTNVIY